MDGKSTLLIHLLPCNVQVYPSYTVVKVWRLAWDCAGFWLRVLPDRTGPDRTGLEHRRESESVERVAVGLVCWSLSPSPCTHHGAPSPQEAPPIGHYPRQITRPSIPLRTRAPKMAGKGCQKDRHLEQKKRILVIRLRFVGIPRVCGEWVRWRLIPPIPTRAPQFSGDN